MDDRFLLDTGLLLGLCREAPWAVNACERLGVFSARTVVSTSIVCVGELTALARRYKWGIKKLATFEKLLNQVPAINLDSESFVKCYADITNWTEGIKRDYPIDDPPPKPANKIGQNDSWVAATARESNLTLLSTDTDFEILRDRWIRFEYIRQE